MNPEQRGPWTPPANDPRPPAAPGSTVPVGVTILMALSLAAGAGSLLFGIIGLLGLAASSAFGLGVDPAGGMFQAWLGVGVMLVGGGFVGATGVALRRLKPWARTAMLFEAGLAGLVGVIFIAQSSVVSPAALPADATAAGQPTTDDIAAVLNVLGGTLLVAAIAVVAYLMHPSVRDRFHQGDVGDGPRSPQAIAAVAGLLLLGTLGSLTTLGIAAPTATLLGVVLSGGAATSMVLVSATASAVAGLGLLRQRAWALWLAVGVVGVSIINSVALVLVPGALGESLAASRIGLPSAPEASAEGAAAGDGRLGMALAIGFGLVLLGILLSSRRAYFAACARAAEARAVGEA